MTTATHQYFIITEDESEESCLIDELPRPLNKQSWMASKGVRMGNEYPSGVRLNMSVDGGLVVPDYIPNTVLLPMVSGRLKSLLEKEVGVEIEFLPFALYNHKKRLAAEDCFIANVIGTHDCADMTKTRGEKSIISPGQFEALSRLDLDPAKVPPDSRLFRISVFPRVLLIRDDLRAIFEQGGISGIRYIAMGERCQVL
ncbi:imm11 family protein [Myxococcus sp. RHSTA-1-4]|uniref:imm11 family protein n=1 Tax=Myxococcus sp. RHSTA-1-4 TaxID=2874601 RepID=UPI001CBB73B3|nr:DUF1629 domain-containing protein [Myxococcus sp. RHSTA-1-4]MBZ4422609.1 hypothetical protein [Myxococcus sp. RHSTA-1-4]